jgi:hypothetical protein
MGTHGSPPTKVPKVPVKWTRPARSPADLQVGPKTLSTTPMTFDDLIQIRGDLPGLWRKLLPRPLSPGFEFDPRTTTYALRS